MTFITSFAFLCFFLFFSRRGLQVNASVAVMYSRFMDRKYVFCYPTRDLLELKKLRCFICTLISFHSSFILVCVYTCCVKDYSFHFSCMI